jgi:phosphoenolpyruvate synthase/pyruvate phosphate dikinase
MLDADVAGVLFTANPFNQSLGEFVITANWGCVGGGGWSRWG